MPYIDGLRKRELPAILKKIDSAVHSEIGQLQVTAYRSPEPLPFAQRFVGKKIALKPGDKWGDLFSCAWFHFTGKVPASARGKRVVLLIDVNGEACIVDKNGNPLQGLTNVNSDYDYSLGTPGKRVVELFASAKGGESIDLWADAGCNDLFGRYRGNGTLKEALVATRCTEMFELLYDFEVLQELMLQLPAESARHRQVAAALGEVAEVLCHYNREEAVAARAILAPHLARKAGEAPLSFSAIGHAHMDLAWLWPIRETKRKCARTFSTVLMFMDRYPEYCFGASQPQQFLWVKEEYPTLYRRMAQRIAEGRFEVQGGMWVEADTNITGGEALVRQFLYGKRFFRKEFGIEVKNLWLPDVFGYSGALPQILKKCGVEYFLTQKISWNLLNKFPHQSFWWQGIDGTKVLAHMMPEETYNSPAAPRSLVKAEHNYLDAAVSDRALLLYGIGDGGGGPGEEHLERLRRVQSLQGLCPVKQEPAARFLEKWKKDSDKFKTWSGELYLERHQGTLTTQARTKRMNRKMEQALRELELSAAWGSLGRGGYPTRQLDAIWQEVLLYQFHDILPGSSITRVYDESLARYATLHTQTLALQARADGALAARINTSAQQKPVVLFNSLSWQREQWLKVGGQWSRVTVPSCGYRVVDAASLPQEEQPGVFATASTLENDLLRVSFAEDGSIASILDKQADREILRAAGNRLAVYEDGGDAWDFPMNYAARATQYFQLEKSQALVDGPVAILRQSYRFGKSTLTQEIRLTAGSRRLDFITSASWRENGKMLRTSFPVKLFATQANCEIQYGSIARPTHQNTSWDLAKFEVNAHKWADISESEYGVALLNDCKYGYCVHGNTLDLNLLRSPSHPDPVADRADHDFRYAIYPHAGNHIAGQVVRAGYEFNIPLRQMEVSAHRGTQPEAASFIATDNPNIVVEAVKKAEDSQDLVVRLYECHGGQTTGRLRLGIPARRVQLVNMLEEKPAPVDFADNQVTLTFGPFEIHTLRITPA